MSAETRASQPRFDHRHREIQPFGTLNRYPIALGENARAAWTEAITRIAEGPIDDSLYDEAKRQFSEKEIVDLTLAVIAINAWNRLAIPFRAPVRSYQPRSAVRP
jgi:alkylhydroperoxidase family enzyme